MTDALKKAQAKYDQKRRVKRVSFHPVKDADLLRFANTVNFSDWAKQKIKDELSSNDQKHGDA